jgi:hypothetical protein
MVGSDEPDPDPTGIAYTCVLNAGAGPLSQPSFLDIEVSTPESVTSGGSFPADITATIDMGEPNLGSITGLAGTFALPITVGDQTTTVNLPSSAWASGDPVTFDLDGTGDLVAPAAAGEAPISIGTITGTLTPTPSGSPLNVPCTPNEGADTALGSINVEEVIPDPVPVPVTGKPAITGTPKVGKKLTAVPGQAAGATITYQWLSNGSPIKKATGKTLKLGSSLKGKKVAVMVMYAKDGFLDVMQTSKAVKVKNK